MNDSLSVTNSSVANWWDELSETGKRCPCNAERESFVAWSNHEPALSLFNRCLDIGDVINHRLVGLDRGSSRDSHRIHAWHLRILYAIVIFLESCILTEGGSRHGLAAYWSMSALPKILIGIFVEIALSCKTQVHTIIVFIGLLWATIVLFLHFCWLYLGEPSVWLRCSACWTTDFLHNIHVFISLCNYYNVSPLITIYSWYQKLKR